MATTEEATPDVDSLLDLLDSFHADQESDRELGLRGGWDGALLVPRSDRPVSAGTVHRPADR
jgi:hypothetical protein